MTVTKTLLFSTLPNTDPAAASPPTTGIWQDPGSWSLVTGADTARIAGGEFKDLSGGGSNAMWRYGYPLSGTLCSIDVILGTSSSSRGCGLVKTNGDGFLVLVRGADIRVFLAVAGQLSGGVLATRTGTFAINDTITTTYDPAIGRFTFYKNGVMVTGGGTTYDNATHLGATLYGAVLSRDVSDGIKSISLTYTPPYSIDTLTSPLVPNGAISGTCTGFSDGAATLNVGTLTASVTVSSGSFSGTMTGFTDAAAYPILPATSLLVTLTQGANTSENIFRDLSLPADTVKEVFGTDLLVNNDKSLAYHFDAASNPLLLNDIVYADDVLTIYKNSLVELATGESPYTGTIWIRRVSDGNMYSHTLLINEAGEIIVDDIGYNLSDLLKITLQNKGFSGTASEMYLAWLKANGASSLAIQDCEKEYLIARGITFTTVQDGWKTYFTGKGYLGALPDMWKTYLINGAPL
jgi:hypothetical protein